MRVVVTGAQGLIGWHAHARLHAANCAAKFNGTQAPFDIVALDHSAFDEDETLHAALKAADAVLHFAGVNRGHDNEIEAANPAIAARLVRACNATGSAPHIIYANSTHAASDTPYGRSKLHASRLLAEAPGLYSDLILPHIFGECARPYYNNVTATLIDQILGDTPPTINPNAEVRLLYAGTAAQTAIDTMMTSATGVIEPIPRSIAVIDLYSILKNFHINYQQNIFPDLTDSFSRDLFNSYRAATYPLGWPRPLQTNTDERGTLFEAVKGGGGGQVFLSTTRPRVTRGHHFHLAKVERFLVLQGEAAIRIRKVLTEDVWEYRVSGDVPTPIDIPTLHTHSIENVGTSDLLTMFWTHELFDPANPDTFADKV